MLNMQDSIRQEHSAASRLPDCEDERANMLYEGGAEMDDSETPARRSSQSLRRGAGVLGIGIEPEFAIGQRSLLQSPWQQSVVRLWKRLKLPPVEHVQTLGGLRYHRRFSSRIIIRR